MIDNIDELAQTILNIKNKNIIYTPKKMSFDQIKKITENYYKNFFNNAQNKKIDLLDSKNSYRKNKALKDFNGRVYYGTINNIIELPFENNNKTAAGLMHEKAHTYQSYKDKNEIIPTFFELLFSLNEDKFDHGLLESNINYKIKEAKKSADNYLYYRKRKIDLSNFEDYLCDFYYSFKLINLYLRKKDYVTKIIESILFKDEELGYLKKVIYEDDDFKNISLNISL